MKDEINNILAMNIRAERSRKNLSKLELAKAIGLCKASINSIEKGIQTPSLLAVYDIACALNIDIDVLLEGIK